MINPFQDQKTFMEACNQTTTISNTDQFNLYLNLIREEVYELSLAQQEGDDLEKLDALIDIMVVTIGAVYSMGANAEGAWQEVMRTNMAKIDSVSGKVRKRQDGKVLKPEGWQPPNLKSFLNDIQ